MFLLLILIQWTKLNLKSIIFLPITKNKQRFW